MARAQDEMIARLADALRSAQQLIKSERDQLWRDCTIPPDRSFKHMNDSEMRAVKKLDRALAKIDRALA